MCFYLEKNSPFNGNSNLYIAYGTTLIRQANTYRGAIVA